MSDKMNIIMITNDHQAYYRHGWDGGVVPKCPCFDALAAEGVSFNRMYAVAPLCVPVRTTLVTGLYPHNHKNVTNNTHAPFNHELIFSALERAGYSSYYFGKWHAGPGKATDFGPEGFSREDYGNPYLSPEYKQYLADRNLEMPRRRIEKVFTTPDFIIQHPDLVEGNEEYVSDKFFSGENAVGVSLGPKESHESFFLAEMACQQLETIAGEREQSGGEPFFMRVDFWGPHHPHFPSQEFVDMYDPADIPVYPSFSDTLENRPQIYRKETFEPIADPEGNLIIPNPLSWERDWQLICSRAYAHITQVDAAGGKIIDALKSLGLDENTVVIWTTDHGDALASHGGLWDKGSYMTEEVMRVPLAIRVPGNRCPGSTAEELANTVDIPATILDLAGATMAETIDGRSLVPFIDQPDARERTALLCETYGIGYGKVHNGKMVVTDTMKYIWNEGMMDELYDLKQDPYEMRNLIDHSRYAETVAELRSKLVRLLVETGGEEETIAAIQAG